MTPLTVALTGLRSTGLQLVCVCVRACMWLTIQNNLHSIACSHMYVNVSANQFVPTRMYHSTKKCLPLVHDWVIKDLGMSSRVCVTGHIKDHVPLIEKSRESCPGGRFPPSFIHQVIITGLNKSYNLCSRHKDGLRYRQGVKPPPKLKLLPPPHTPTHAFTHRCTFFIVVLTHGLSWLLEVSRWGGGAWT